MERQTEIRIIARLLDEQAEQLDGLIVLAVRDGRLVQAYSSLTPQERRAMLDAAKETR